MAQEKVFADFRGGMNALAAVDKLDPTECLLAENVRLDETGNILSAGAYTIQNQNLGTNVHSLYMLPGLAAVAGVDKDVWLGRGFGFASPALSRKLSGTNVSSQKMSFAPAPGRIFFDVGSSGYWTDGNNMLAVDWAPPASGSPAGPNLVQTGTDVGGSGIAWTNPGNIANATNYATVTYTDPSADFDSTNLQGLNPGFSIGATTVIGIKLTVDYNLDDDTGGGQFPTQYGLSATLVVGGEPVGTVKFLILNKSGTATFGSESDLWGLSAITNTQINALNFGVRFQLSRISSINNPVTGRIKNASFSVYQAGSVIFAGTGAAGALTGTYTWKATFVSSRGEEGAASQPTVAVTLSAQQGTLTAIPTGDARTATRNIYRKGGALTSYYLVATIDDNVSSTYSDNQTDIAALAAGVILAGDVPGDYPNSRLGNTQVRFPAFHYDRVFWINTGKPNQLVWSKPLNGFAYPSVNFVNVGDSEPILRIVSIFGELIIIKTDSIWRLTGTDETSFDLTQTPSAVGTDEPFTVVALPDKVLFANRWGLWLFNGYTSQPLTTKLDMWFKQKDNTNVSLFGVNGFHPPEISYNATTLVVPVNFEAVGNSEKYYLSYAEVGQTKNNAVLVFDIKHSNITKRAGFNALSLAINPVTGLVFMGNNTGKVSLLDDWNGATQGTANVNFDFMYGYQDLQRGSNKALWALEFFLNTNGQSLTPFVYYDNGTSSETLPAISTTSLQRVVRTMEASTARKMQNFSWRLNGSLTSVNVSGTPQVQIVHVKALYDLRVGRARTGQ